MIRVERATPDDFERVLPLLEGFNNPRITREQWRSLFHYPWPCDDDTRGFTLLDGERPVGFFGVILYEREIGGTIEKFGNLSSWITLPEYRNHSLKLFQAAVSIEGRTLLCLTPRIEILPLYLRSGFQKLERKLCILHPLPSFSAPLSWLRYRSTTSPARIRRRLAGNDIAIFEHHNLPHCRHLLIHNAEAYCHIVFTRTKGNRFHFARVHHISNPEIFIANLDRVRLRLGLSARALFVMIDTHLLPPVKLQGSRVVEARITPVFKSERLTPGQIDNLYTEDILLDL
jgi:hypothetical protein